MTLRDIIRLIEAIDRLPLDPCDRAEAASALKLVIDGVELRMVCVRREREQACSAYVDRVLPMFAEPLTPAPSEAGSAAQGEAPRCARTLIASQRASASSDIRGALFDIGDSLAG